MHSAFSRTDHRPWPLSAQGWTWRQSWVDLAFLHWPVPVSALRALVPPELTIQEFDGTSWLGVVPFRMEGVTRRYLPDVPGVSAFPELNVRLYVEAEGKPGVWFLSLDATQPLAVWAARRLFHLPYHRADISLIPGAAPAIQQDSESGHPSGHQQSGQYSYQSQRRADGARFKASYRPVGRGYAAQPGTLLHFLTERYCLYAKAPNGDLLRNDVHHVPWPLFDAEATIEESTLLDAFGLTQLGPPPLVHFSPRLDVVVWNAEKVIG